MFNTVRPSPFLKEPQQHTLASTGLEVITDMLLKIQRFWNVTPCKLVNIYRLFRVSYCLPDTANKERAKNICICSLTLSVPN
jgi:hypothetical protein